MSSLPHVAPAPGPQPYRPANHVRLVSAASLFDGHDVAINIMRRLLQSTGAEVIHLGHNRSVREIVDCAVQEDAQGIAVTSYQGGHLEYLKYMHDLVEASGRRILIFAGGGGTILPDEIEQLHAYGIARVFSPDDGRELGLQGVINEVMRRCDFPVGESPTPAGLAPLLEGLPGRDPRALARLISLAENHPDHGEDLLAAVRAAAAADRLPPVLGVTGTGGAGKSSLVDELVRRWLLERPAATVAIVSVDPSRRRSGGALLGDRIRMNAIDDPRVYMRSLATRQSNLALSRYVRHAIDICRAAAFDLVIVETSGIGQSDTEIVDHADLSLYVMTAEYGAASQLEKIDMLDYADVIAINKFDHRGSLDALRDVRRQFRRNRNRFDGPDEDLPVFATVASQFNDGGVNRLYAALAARLDALAGHETTATVRAGDEHPHPVIPPERVRYWRRSSSRAGPRTAAWRRSAPWPAACTACTARWPSCAAPPPNPSRCCRRRRPRPTTRRPLASWPGGTRRCARNWRPSRAACSRSGRRWWRATPPTSSATRCAAARSRSPCSRARSAARASRASACPARGTGATSCAGS